ncbi:MAG: hypothetical protein M0R76_12955 [Proteobacteria bacterium]|nr:hypothetical protein [Pseudomonadota bacterium]
MKVGHTAYIMGVFVSALLVWGCGAPVPVAVTTSPSPPASPNAETAHIPAPDAPLSLSFAEVPWLPVTIGGNGVATLSEALSERQTVMILRGEGMAEPLWEDKLFQLVAAAAPQARIVARGRAALDTLLIEHGDIPYRRTWEVGGADVFGRPWMLPKDHPLRTDWLDKQQVLKGAEVLMTVDLVRVDAPRLAQLRKEHRGGCEALYAQFNTALSQNSAYFDSLLDALNGALRNDFVRRLNAVRDAWKADVARGLASGKTTGDQRRCLRANDEFLRKFDDCSDAHCPMAPHIFSPSGVLGMELSFGAMVPAACKGVEIADYRGAVLQMGQDVVTARLSEIPVAWAEAFYRLQMLTQAQREMNAFCAPAHRRLRESDIERAREQLSAFLQAVSQGNVDAQWRLERGQERVPTVGSVEVLAAVAAKPGNALHTAWDATVQILRTAGKCTDGRRRPVMLSLIDVKTSEVFFSAIAFEEQLFCEDLPPGHP